MDSIYKTPQSQVESGSAQSAADYSLYKITGIGLATFFGSLFAGGLLIYFNLRRMGQFVRARNILWGTGILTVLVLAVGFLIPEDWNVPNTVFLVPQVIVMIYYAKNLLDQPILEHQQAGGKMESNWKAFGISLLILLGIFVIAFLLVFILGIFGFIAL